jgi:hypothetical protein
LNSRVTQSFLELANAIDRDGWGDWDQCDVTGHPLGLRMESIKRGVPGGRYAVAPWTLLVRHRPMWIRRALRIRPRVFPQALGNLARGYLSAHRAGLAGPWEERARACLDWLINHPSSTQWGLAWGQPYDWYSMILMPAHTPRATVTSICTHALLDGWETLGEPRYRLAALETGAFFLEGLRRTPDGDGDYCFSYTPLDDFHVHNASMDAAGAMVRLWRNGGDDRLRDVALGAYRYTVKHQRPDGSWNYFGPPDDARHPLVIDNYHTGYVLEGLREGSRALAGDWPFAAALSEGFRYWFETFVGEDGRPRERHDAPLPLDIQSCAQTVITLAEFHDVIAEHPRTAAALNWILENMQSHDGRFYYRWYHDRRVDRTHYLRWGDSWMVRGLGAWLELDTGRA